jgi:hypothetical protein
VQFGSADRAQLLLKAMQPMSWFGQVQFSFALSYAFMRLHLRSVFGNHNTVDVHLQVSTLKDLAPGVQVW